MNTLLLTSCNRIKQVLLSFILNSYIIKNPFNVIITDCSSLGVPFDEVIKLYHDSTIITIKNYCSDITLFHKYIPLIPNIKSYKIIHHFPKMDKHYGEANLIKLGLSQIDLMSTKNDIHLENLNYAAYNDKLLNRINNNFCLKLTGVSILNYDIIETLPILLDKHDIFTFRKIHQTNLASTRIFGCRPNILNSYLEKEENYAWSHDHFQFVEDKFDYLLKKYDKNKINHINKDESAILLDRLYPLNRISISNFIKTNNIPTEHPIIQEFLEGNIYE